MANVDLQSVQLLHREFRHKTGRNKSDKIECAERAWFNSRRSAGRSKYYQLLMHSRHAPDQHNNRHQLRAVPPSLCRLPHNRALLSKCHVLICEDTLQWGVCQLVQRIESWMRLYDFQIIAGGEFVPQGCVLSAVQCKQQWRNISSRIFYNWIFAQ